jgi:hypothetical protein
MLGAVRGLLRNSGMKKIPKKVRLAKETMQHLSRTHLEGANGGEYNKTFPRTLCGFTCPACNSLQGTNCSVVNGTCAGCP